MSSISTFWVQGNSFTPIFRVKEIGRKKELAEENLQQIASIAVVRTQQAGSNLRKRTLATPPPMASGSHLHAKPVLKRRRIKIES